MSGKTLCIEGVTRSFPGRGRAAPTLALQPTDLSVAPGEFVAILGPSGCGKSTLLRMIAGLETISDGDLVIGGNVMNDVPAAQRGIAMVFQSYALYPHMNVYKNMAFALETARMPKAEIDRRVRQAAEVHRQVRKYIRTIAKPGILMTDLCEKLENAGGDA